MSGTSNSGRHRQHGILEQRLRIDIRTFHTRGWWGEGWHVLRWSADGEESGSIGYQVSGNAVTFAWSTRDDDDKPLPVRLTVDVDRLACRFGGFRRYWLCPRCRCRCEVLASGWNGRSWACRRCLRLRYQSQALTREWRLQQRADKLYGRLGGDSEGACKPKWMRWRTFNRKLAQADDFSNRADSYFVGRVMAITGMFPDELAEWVLKR